MIPRQSPPFSLSKLFRLVGPGGAVGVGDFEAACAEMLKVRQAVVLPSARAGILLTLRSVMAPELVVVGPAFVCGVVHEAMARSGAALRFVDCVPDGVVMNTASLPELPGLPWALILTDTYGIAMDASMLREPAGHPPVVRIWDMAMCVPQPPALSRLAANDVALLSFGLGKCMYAGWGGALVTNSTSLAERLRELRDASADKETPRTRLRHGVSVLARTIAHQRWFYGMARSFVTWSRTGRRTAAAAKPPRLRPETVPAGPLSREWREPMTPLNRKLALWNLRRAAESAECRRRQAEAYYRCLQPLGIVHGFDGDTLPQSHFPVRVAAAARPQVREYLCRQGIDTATYFPFPRGLRGSEYPHAARAAEQVVLLPLGECLDRNDIEAISGHVVDAIRMFHGSTDHWENCLGTR